MLLNGNSVFQFIFQRLAWCLHILSMQQLFNEKCILNLVYIYILFTHLTSSKNVFKMDYKLYSKLEENWEKKGGGWEIEWGQGWANSQHESLSECVVWMSAFACTRKCICGNLQYTLKKSILFDICIFTILTLKIFLIFLCSFCHYLSDAEVFLWGMLISPKILM